NGDPVLKYFGYWTDNGADYYYNYDTTLGYAQTLLALREKYRREGIPLGYMQLDSWWYEKSIYDPEGKPDADHKNPKLPYGKWNRYGGLMNYTADPYLFPAGLASFRKELGIPLVTHNRWIDPQSPYHKKYNFTGFGATDTKFWADIIGYIKQSGVTCYEQDWLNYIYNKTPHMAEDPEAGNAFTDAMAKACKDAGLTMQYCMAMPRYFMQGLKYNNLTTIRISGDRFEPQKWKHFIYTSVLAYEMGILPWCDVFKSDERGNMTLAVLSSGAVGTGDAIGREDKSNIMMARRSDGVLVKPDISILPFDADYINDANGIVKPMLAFTFTKHNAITTDYVFAFAIDKCQDKTVSIQPSILNQKGKVIVYNPLTGSLKRMNASDTYSDVMNASGYIYFIIAPLLPNGIAFLGDSGKIISTGKQRILKMKASQNDLFLDVAFASGEHVVTLHGYYDKPVTADRGKLILYPDKKMFDLLLSPPENENALLTVHLKTRQIRKVEQHE
ncbi:MAG: hypothetical protein KGJ59_14175, partial [Bacteroidota bacterium]|nr:hypothetical protein [Bacteroidota bacterium]